MKDIVYYLTVLRISFQRQHFAVVPATFPCARHSPHF